MKIAIIGSHNLTPEETNAARFLLDAVLCRYATGTPTLITAARPGIETLAITLARKWYWAEAVEEAIGLEIRILKNRFLDRQIADTCDILISVQRRGERPSVANDKVRNLGKKVWEFYV